jgi:hypothetical protein
MSNNTTPAVEQHAPATQYLVVTGFAHPFFQSNTRMPSERVQDAWTTDNRSEAERVADALNARTSTVWQPIYRVESVTEFKRGW